MPVRSITIRLAVSSAGVPSGKGSPGWRGHASTRSRIRACWRRRIRSTRAEFERRLREENHEGRAYLVGKLMRQAKPDDVFTVVTVDEIVALWPLLTRYLGRQRPFWTWLLEYWGYRLEAA